MRLLGYTCTSVHALEFSNINVLSKLKACYYTSKTLMFKNCVSSNKWTMFFFVAGKNMRNVARWNWSAKSSASGYYSYWWEGKSLWRGKVIIPCGMQTHLLVLILVLVDNFRNRKERAVSHAYVVSIVLPFLA